MVAEIGLEGRARLAKPRRRLLRFPRAQQPGSGGVRKVGAPKCFAFFQHRRFIGGKVLDDLESGGEGRRNQPLLDLSEEVFRDVAPVFETFARIPGQPDGQSQRCLTGFRRGLRARPSARRRRSSPSLASRRK